jgi:hypothetical protein
MNPDGLHERELQALAGLFPVAPGPAWEGRVHARCRAALVKQPRSGGVAPRLLDAALVMAIGLYLASAVTEAVRLVAGA